MKTKPICRLSDMREGNPANDITVTKEQIAAWKGCKVENLKTE